MHIYRRRYFITLRTIGPRKFYARERSKMKEYWKAWREIVGILLAGAVLLIFTVGGDIIGELLQKIQ